MPIGLDGKYQSGAISVQDSYAGEVASKGEYHRRSYRRHHEEVLQHAHPYLRDNQADSGTGEITFIEGIECNKIQWQNVDAITIETDPSSQPPTCEVVIKKLGVGYTAGQTIPPNTLNVLGNTYTSGTFMGSGAGLAFSDLTIGGSLFAGGDVVAYSSSDERFKDNQVNIPDALDKLRLLNGIEFDWNDKQDTYTGHDIGLRAQDVEKVLPEIVTTRLDGAKAIKYDRTVALIIEAIKELEAKVECL